VEHDGTVRVELYDGTAATVRFVDERGAVMRSVQASYVSDETGLTVLAVPQDDRHHAAIRSFPNQQGVESSLRLAAPVLADMSDITIDFEPIVFDDSVYVEETIVNLVHLEKLPTSMPGWDEEHLSGDEICGPVAWGLTLGHGVVALVHASISPPTGIPHLKAAIVLHGPVHVLCEGMLGSDPASEYVVTLNQQLDYAIVRQKVDNMSSDGIVIGQVVDDVTNEGVPGASVSLHHSSVSNHQTTTLNNGWYVLKVPGGKQHLWAEAAGYGGGLMDVTVKAGEAQQADPLPLIPNSQTEALRRGDVTVTLRWNTEDDLDLHVTDPDSETIFYNHPRSASGGRLDVDSNAGCSNTTTSPVENIFWPGGEAPGGQYTIKVHFFRRCGSSRPVTYEVVVNVDGRSAQFSGTVTNERETDSVTGFFR
jgi:hypothetical protein